jgi:hypothetical protein
VVEDGDLDVSIKPLKEHSIISISRLDLLISSRFILKAILS